MANIIIDPVGDVPPLGRNTEATLDAWSKIQLAMPVAPRWRTFSAPSEPIDLTKFDPGYDGAVGGEDAEDYYQDRGFCVGWALATLFWFMSCMPANLLTGKRIRAARTSPLYAYMLARRGAKQNGVNLGLGDGAIVSYAVLDAMTNGMMTWLEKPCTSALERAHRNGTMPTAEELALGKTRAPASGAVIKTRQQLDEYLDGGYVIDAGTSWTRGLSRPNQEGNLESLAGFSLGGHSYLIFPAGVFPGTSTRRLGVKNSHPMYGVRSKDKRYAASDGWTNIAYADRDAYLSRFMSDRALSSGQSEAAVVAGPKGFVPLVQV
jgi:hypothetical protein